ncbi:MAG: hypothetical protein HFF08_10260 [Oscillospiraceae bacterium]|nr:hypothetical protein [Oscillospiraceae bacterium]
MGVLFDFTMDYGGAEDPDGTEKKRTFKDFAAADIHAVFLNGDEFAEKRDIRFDGETYRDVLVVAGETGLQGKQEKNFLQTQKDHGEGLYKRVLTVHLALADTGGKQPEFGSVFEMNDAAGESFFRLFYVMESGQDSGMLALRLAETDE